LENYKLLVTLLGDQFKGGRLKSPKRTNLAFGLEINSSLTALKNRSYSVEGETGGI